jgi:predicted AlkP superfamily pyrophosphatase or phosphodiesterase
MRRGVGAALGAAVLVALGCHPANQATANQTTAVAPACGGGRGYVIMLSLDGFKPAYLEDAPNLSEMAATGARAESLIPVFPSKTFPNHYSIVTGLYVEHHGLAGNRFWDPARRQWYFIGDTVAVRDASWYAGEPIWVTAERQGVRSAAFLWPASEAPIGGVRPSRYKIFARDDSVPMIARADSLVSWLALPACERPHLILGYMEVVDHAGHAAGPDAPLTRAAVREADSAVGRLLDGVRVSAVRDSVTVIVVSDHGMARIDSVVDAAALVHADSTAPGEQIAEGPIAAMWFDGDTARARRAHAVLVATLRHARVYTRDELPARFRANVPRIGDLVLVADDGWAFGSPAKPHTAGNHGYDPMQPDMRAVFIANGAGIRRGVVLPAFENVNIYSLIAHLLALEPAPTDGNIALFQKALR